MALGGFGAKCRTGWSGWSGVDGVDTPWTVMTTRAPAVLKRSSPLMKATPNRQRMLRCGLGESDSTAMERFSSEILRIKILIVWVKINV